MPPARKCSVVLQPGDVVSAAAYSWGAEFAKQQGDKGGRSEKVRIKGTIIKADGNKWVVDFGDDKNIAWKRSELRFVSRPDADDPTRGSKRSWPAPRQDSSDEEEVEAEDESSANYGNSDSSDLEDAEADGAGRFGRPNHAMPAAGLVADANWIRRGTTTTRSMSAPRMASRPRPRPRWSTCEAASRMAVSSTARSTSSP